MNRNALLASVAAAGCLGGGVGGYLLASHKLRRQFDERLDDEVAALRDHYEVRTRRLAAAVALAPFEVRPAMGSHSVGGSEAAGEVAGSAGDDEDSGSLGTDRSVRRDQLERVGAIDYQRPADVTVAADEDDEEYEPDAARSLGSNGGIGDDDEVDDDSEADRPEDVESDEDGPAEAGSEPDPRGPGPYVISAEEFFEEHNHSYEKLAVVYYSGDKILCDDKDSPIRDVRGTVGVDVAKYFGQGEDPNIVYIRNDRLKVDFEVALSYESYVTAILKYGTPNPKPSHIFPDGV